MVTSKNSAVGCSVKECADQGFTLVICQYNGLFTSRDTLYAVGKPCSGCADPNVNRKCDTALGGGLCIKP
ncbi:hypothetical protein Y032_0256g354 [Ancylostoma ceylanicum]|nr:hypothetical protein Y032_0256g354 [Ancylostoma ceylanicum]